MFPWRLIGLSLEGIIISMLVRSNFQSVSVLVFVTSFCISCTRSLSENSIWLLGMLRGHK